MKSLRSPEEDGGKTVRVVGIGASAGGLDACKALLGHLPADTGMAFIVVLHLAPTRESHLAELLSQSTSMPVVEASSEMRLSPDHVYVIVPDTDLDVRDGTLYPRRLEHRDGVRMPIDALFAALAKSHHEDAIGVVLSGTGDDGTSGLRRIKESGGVCLVQEPDDAAFDGMPRAAIATGVVDGVLAAAEMGQALVDLVGKERAVVATPGRPDEDSGSDEHETPQTDDGIDEILELVSAKRGLSFERYRRKTLSRRISRRMSMNHFSDSASYLGFLHDNPAEIDQLYNDLLIDVTSFFRDPEVWEFLADEVVPDIIETAGEGAPLRFWVPACSSGEEAYSLAIVLLETLRRTEHDFPVRIFATDVNRRAIVRGRRGLYASAIANDVGDERLERYFNRHGENFQIKARVRELVTFAVHDLLTDPPFARINLVSCRNLLIYLEPDAQKRALELMSYALAPRSYLILGTSESIERRSHDFEVVSQPLRIYRSTADATQSAAERTPRWSASHSPVEGLSRPSSSPGDRGRDSELEHHLERYILSQHVPAAVVVDEQLHILQFYGPTDDFLVAPTGAAQFDLLAWVRPGLYGGLQPALERAIDEGDPVDVERMYVERHGETHPVACYIEPLSSIPGAEELYLVTFRESSAEPTASGEPSTEERSLIKRLESQLRTLRRENKNFRDRLEDRNEEYQAHHEELLSLNEELQSTNEELETSKEELQSLNEEMLTVNRELEEKNEELRELNADLNNLLLSTQIPTIFLDTELRVRRFTPASTRVMRLVPSDVGRSIEHVKQRFDDPGLVDAAADVVAGGAPVHTQIETDEGRHFKQHIAPYRTSDGVTGGVCITYTDITEQKERVHQIEEARQYAEAIVRTIRTPLLVLDSELHVVSANQCFHETFQTTDESVVGQFIFESGDGQWDIPGLRSLLEKVLPERLEVDDYGIEHEFDRLGRRFLRLNARSLDKPDGASLILLAIEDLTARRRAEVEAKRRAEALAAEHARKDEFLAMLGHELRNPLGALTYGLKVLEGADANERDPKTFQMMSRQLTRMTRMLDQLLDIARAASGKIALETELVDLAEVIGHALQVVAPLIESHDHELTRGPSPEGDVLVVGDANRLAQVMENLLTNAIKYTDEGGEIVVTLERDAEHATVSVRDSGIGIDPDLLPHVFDLFTQASQDLQRSEGGLGLGLSLARQIIELHDGVLTAHSDGRGEGSEFVITLPLADETSGDVIVQSSVDEASPRRVLIVDDEEDATSLLAQLLESGGHETRTASDGPTALELASAFDPEIIFLDLGLPGMSGYEVARAFRNEVGDRPRIVAVTGYQEDPERLEEAGFDGHIIKPPDLDSVISWIREFH